MDRRWAFINAYEIESLAKNLKPEDYASDWMTDKENFEYAQCILGKKITLDFDDGLSLYFDFFSKENLYWSENNSKENKSYYRAICAPGYPEVVFIHQYRDGMVPSVCVDVVIDLETGYATAIIGTLGVKQNPREVSHTIHFGKIKGINYNKKIDSHNYTTDMIGKAIHWEMPAFTNKPPIKHIYLSEKYYAIFMTRKDECFMSADPADYVKIKDGLYLISVIEQRRSGIQLCFLINTDTLQDIVGHFGISAGNELDDITPSIVCTVMTGRKGTFVPMETLF